MNKVINSWTETRSYEPAQGRMQITQYNGTSIGTAQIHKIYTGIHSQLKSQYNSWPMQTYNTEGLNPQRTKTHTSFIITVC